MTSPEELTAQMADVVDGLTRIALAREWDGGLVDVAECVALVLASAAANVGGLDRLLAGRSGSWEASLVAELVQGRVGFDSDVLWVYRTAPVVVPVHVAQLVESLYGLPGIDQARDQLDVKHYALTDLDQFDQDTFYADNDALHATWRSAYRTYGEAVRAAVLAYAAALPGLRVPVVVEVRDDPDDRWWRPDAAGLNPTEDGDHLAWLLWDHATTAVPLPVDEHGTLITPDNGGDR